jgi:uncharacterized SAM-binding protein YcdF (DUF218 family)
MNTTIAPAGSYRVRRLQQMLRALVLSLVSGGLLPWLVLRRIVAVARGARCRIDDAEVLLVPGYGLDRCEVRPPHAARLDRAFRLWQRDPQRWLLLSGAAPHAEAPSEAVGGLAHLCDLGLPSGASVLLDPAARDTEENLLNALGLLVGHGRASARVTIISNRWHLARCAWLAAHHGLDWRITAAERRWRPGPFAYLALVREALALLALAGADARRIEPLRLLRPSRAGSGSQPPGDTTSR